ncbi:hypothetical protein C922_02266 [Plasmodium inui San Antonio 1]|uniref:RRM domain-containing protein n=1 Tax=Plasmodium inui San Antonio 1 TaxID=1237626 RepID=W7AP23_9APIC|nr:hypothetical protein C922_02266 [Plasmodium inui San Antonio 1]EUD67116.1 hypothetical protein C922_02266 [Plasmodium inui San Antonio 1]
MVENGCSLLIKNLSFQTSPDKIRKIFQSFGKVRDVYLPLDHYTRRPRGFGFVEYYEPQYAKEALTILNNSKIDGKEIKIIVAQNRRKSPETMKMYQHNAREGRYRRHRYRSDSGGKRIHRSRNRSTEQEKHRYDGSKSRIMHKMNKKEKRLKREKMTSRYRYGKKYVESVSTYSASSSYRSSYSRGSNRRSSRSRDRSRSQSRERRAVRSTSITTSYSNRYSHSYSASSYESDKGRRKTKRKSPKRGQRKGQKEGTAKAMKRESSETFRESVSLSNSEGANRDGGPVKYPQEGIERGSGKDPGKDPPKDMRGQSCKSFSRSGKSQEGNKDSQKCASKRGSYSTEEENQPGEKTHHDGESLKRGERVKTIKTKKRTKSINNSTEDTIPSRDPDGKKNSNEEPPQLSSQERPTNGQNKQPYFLDRLEENKTKKKKGTKKKAKSLSPSSTSDVISEGVTQEEARGEAYSERESPPAKRVQRKRSNNNCSRDKKSGYSQGAEEEQSSPRVTEQKRICLSIARSTNSGSNTDRTQKDHLRSGEAQNGNGVNTKNKSSSSATGKENRVHLKEHLELSHLSRYDNANGGDNSDSGEDCIGGDANSSSRISRIRSTSSSCREYRGCKKRQKQKYPHKGKNKKRINESHSTDRSSTAEKRSVRSRSKEGKRGKNDNGDRKMMQNGRRKRGRVTLSINDSRGGSNGGGKVRERKTTTRVRDREATSGDTTRERSRDSEGESPGRAKITLRKNNTRCSSSGSPVEGEKKRGNTHCKSGTAHRSRSICDDAMEQPDGKNGVSKRKRSSSGSGSDGQSDDESDGRDTRRLKRGRMSEDEEDTPREKRSRQGKKTRTASNSIDKTKQTKSEKLNRGELQEGDLKKKSKRTKSKKEKSTKGKFTKGKSSKAKSTKAKSTKEKSRKTKFTKIKSPKKSYDSSTYNRSSRSRSSAGSSIESSSSHSESSKMEKSMKHFSAKGSKGKTQKRDVRRGGARRIDSDTSDDSSSSVSCGDSSAVRRKR